jgi:cytochrome b561
MPDPARDPAAVGSGLYPAVAIWLHWIIAAAIIAQVVLAGRMEGPRTPETFAVTQLHKSIGITILLLSLARLGWRLIHRPPPLPATLKPWQRTLARTSHVGFYVIMIGMPLTGWAMVSASSFARPILLFGVVPWPLLPGVRGLQPSLREAVHDVTEFGHHGLIKVFYVLIALHVAGALKHQLFSRDEPVLARMAPGAVAGRRLEPRLLAVLAGVVAVLLAAQFLPPPDPGFPMEPGPPAIAEP